MKTILVILAGLTMSLRPLNNSTDAGSSLTLKIHGRDFEQDVNSGASFYHQCVTAEISNPGSHAEHFSIAAGTFLHPDDAQRQRLMVTKSEDVVVPSNGKKTLQLFAMCTQAHHSCPLASTKFTIGSRAGEDLAKLAEMIERNNYQNSAAQNAVWALSDNSGQSGIYDGDTIITHNLRQYVAQAKHENYLPANSPASYNAMWFKPINVKYKYYMASTHKVTMRLYTTDSRIFKPVCEDSLTASGNHEYQNRFMVPKNPSSAKTELKMIRWQDDVIVDVKYFTDADTAFVRQ